MSKDQFPVCIVHYSVRKWIQIVWLFARSACLNDASGVVDLNCRLETPGEMVGPINLLLRA